MLYCLILSQMLNNPVTQFHHMHQTARYSCSSGCVTYSQKVWQGLNLVDWPKLAQTKILADFNLVGGQAQPRHTPTPGTCACTLAQHDTTSTSNMECELAMDSCFRGHHVFSLAWVMLGPPLAPAPATTALL